MKYEITEEQIKELAKGNAKVQRWFPEAFEIKLEIGKWYKVENNGRIYLFNHQPESKSYGFFEGNWKGKSWSTGFDCWYEKKPINATESEVFEALKREAVKRGFINGVRFNCPYTGETETLAYSFDYELVGYEPEIEKFGKCLRDNAGSVIFYKGIWSEIIPPIKITKLEAERLLKSRKSDNYKITD